MALVENGHILIAHEFATLRLRVPFLDRCPFVIGYLRLALVLGFNQHQNFSGLGLPFFRPSPYPVKYGCNLLLRHARYIAH